MMPTEADLDSDDMRALQNGEDRALDRLMTRWQNPLRSFLFRHTQNEAVALDLAQETFVRVYQARARFRDNARFSTWLFAIAFNLARDNTRRQYRHPTESLDATNEPIDSHHAFASAEEQERTTAVRAAIADLPDDLRAAVLLFEYEGHSHAEIATIIGASTKAVETRLYRARQQLKKALVRYIGK